MNNNPKNRIKTIHLYNPKQEGLGTYDIHYINAYRKNEIVEELSKERRITRYAA